jgi:predicted phosphodiesterase
MRTAIISDIHGELDRLHRVLRDIDRRACDRILSLGDNVDERRSGAAVLPVLIERSIPGVLGNCDNLCDLPEGSPEEAYRDALPHEHREGDVLFTHISPIHNSRGVRDIRDAAQLFAGSRQRLCFTGHIHIPNIFVNDPQHEGRALHVPFDYGEPVALDSARRYAICVGAVGRGRDGIDEPRYAIWDDAAGTVEIVLVR